MPRSDFYVLPTPDLEARHAFVHKLVEKVQALGHRVYIRVESEAAAQALDQRLWDFREDAFVPHGLLAAREEAPVEIGYGDSLPAHRDVFINLALEIPPQALTFERAIEIVVQEEQVLAATRANYKQYQAQGFEIRMNDMRRR